MDECESDDSLSIIVVSEASRIPLILERVAQFARRQGVWDSDGLLLVVRELLMNAIQHGNGSDMARTAMIRVARRGGLFEVQVDDEGGASTTSLSSSTCPRIRSRSPSEDSYS